MLINATDFKNNVGKFLAIAKKEEVIITKNGRKYIKLIPVEESSITDSLIGVLKDANSVDLDKERMERIMGK